MNHDARDYDVLHSFIPWSSIYYESLASTYTSKLWPATSKRHKSRQNELQKQTFYVHPFIHMSSVRQKLRHPAIHYSLQGLCSMKMSHLMTKPTKWHVRLAKTLIRLGIRPVWSESSLSAFRKLGSLATHCAHSKDSDQTGWMPRLIWVLLGAHSFCWFCHEVAQMVYVIATINVLSGGIYLIRQLRKFGVQFPTHVSLFCVKNPLDRRSIFHRISAKISRQGTSNPTPVPKCSDKFPRVEIIWISNPQVIPHNYPS